MRYLDLLLAGVFLACAYLILGGTEDESLLWRVLSVKGVLALAAAALAFRMAHTFRVPGVGTSWTFFAVGMLVLAAGELLYSWHQWFGESETPFPSLADVLFTACYVPLLVGLLGLLRSYAEVFPGAISHERRAVLVGMILFLAALAFFVVRPVLERSDPTLHKAIYVSYVVLDVALLAPLVLLARIAYAFRGGSVARAWAALLAGFFCIECADIVFSFDPVGLTPFPYFDEIFYVAGYVLILKGMLLHRRLTV